MRSEMVTNLIGQKPISALVDRRKLVFLGGLCRLSDEAVAKQVLNERLKIYHMDATHTGGFVRDIIEIAQKYNLHNIIEAYVNRNMFPSKYEWKKIMDSHILERWVVNRNNIMENDAEFSIFKQTIASNTYSPSGLWVVAKQFPGLLGKISFLVMALVTSKLSRQILCQCCGLLVENHLKHIVLECEQTKTERKMFWLDIAKYSNVLKSSLQHMSKDALYACCLGSNTLCNEHKLIVIPAAAKLFDTAHQYLDENATVYTAAQWSRTRKNKKTLVR